MADGTATISKAATVPALLSGDSRAQRPPWTQQEDGNASRCFLCMQVCLVLQSFSCPSDVDQIARPRIRHVGIFDFDTDGGMLMYEYDP